MIDCGTRADVTQNDHCRMIGGPAGREAVFGVREVGDGD